jgi:hypothetical protein
LSPRLFSSVYDPYMTPAEWDRLKDLEFLRHVRQATLTELYIIWHELYRDSSEPEDWKVIALQRAFARHGCV